MQLVFLLLSNVENVVFGDLIGSQHKGQPVANIFQVFRGSHRDAIGIIVQCGLGSEDYVLQMFPLIVVANVEDFVVLAQHGIAIESLHPNLLPKSVEIARQLEFFLLGRKVLNDLI